MRIFGKDGFGIQSLKKDGLLLRDCKAKAEILSWQYKSVWTPLAITTNSELVNKYFGKYKSC